MEYYSGSLCEVWQNVTTVGHKKNTYTLWVTRSEGDANLTEGPVSPVHYEMMGYNTLLGSHYDKYLIDYHDFSTVVDPKIFTLPEGLWFAAKRRSIKEGAAFASFVSPDRYDLRGISWSGSGTSHVGQPNERPHPHIGIGPLSARLWPFQRKVPTSV